VGKGKPEMRIVTSCTLKHDAIKNMGECNLFAWRRFVTSVEVWRQRVESGDKETREMGS
jgi:hypothetical protein